MRKRLTEFVSYAKDCGAGLAFLTMTAAHTKNQPLQHSVDAVETAWRQARAGRPGKRVKQEFGLLGVVSVIDVTHTANGWHFHIHAIVVVKSKPNASACAARLAERYEQALVAMGLRVSDPAPTNHKSVYDEEGLAMYLAKHWRSKPEAGSKTPLQLLALGLQGSQKDLELYLEAMEAFQHKHRGVVSPQLHRALGKLKTAPRHKW